ncbi:P-loop containing nucleoside triphosphate hydrolase protein [Scleroderma yunnanense]
MVPSQLGKCSPSNWSSLYLSGRFSSGYRATIGTDFIAKTIPHPSGHDEFIALQIWDTAGQERFSGLSSAFYRGADAVLLMFDVNRPESLTSLTKWWSEFCQRAPVPDEEMEDYCCVLVGNKIDLIGSDSTPQVSEAEALHFLEDLIPRSTTSPTSSTEQLAFTPEGDAEEHTNSTSRQGDADAPSLITRSRCIHINHHRGRNISKSRSQSVNRLNNTVSSTHTGLTSYHTPSSSLFDVYSSARSSPSPPPDSSRQSSPTRDRIPRRMTSLSSTSSTATITPSLFTHVRADSATPPTPLPSLGSEHFPPRPDCRPKLFFTSAKTGEGVSDVFEYITRRVIMRWDYEEAMDAFTCNPQDSMSPTGQTIDLSRRETRWTSGRCCGQ